MSAQPQPQPLTDQRNTTEESILSKKGEIKLCPMCRNATLPPTMRLHCKWCMGTGYVAVCLPCGGTGIVRAPAAWNQQRSHGSTCNTCGGQKYIPSRLSEFEKWEREHPPAPEIEASSGGVGGGVGGGPTGTGEPTPAPSTPVQPAPPAPLLPPLPSVPEPPK